MSNHPYLVRPYPLITPRIAFKRAPSPPLPVLSTEVEYNPKDLIRKRQGSQNEEDSTQRKKCRRSQTTSPSPMDDKGDESDEEGENAPTRRSSSPSRRRQALPLIPKPQGEPGRPGAGGYRLETTLATHNWSKEYIEKFMTTLKVKSREKLNPGSTFSKQSKQKIQDICEELQREMPQLHLERFEDCWPVTAALKAHLKYTAEYSRRVENKVAVDRMRSAAQTE